MRNRLSTICVILPACVVLSVSSTFPSAAKAHPQGLQAQQEQSVADAARRSREQKKSAAKQSKIISNEDLDLEYYKPSQEGYNFGAPSDSSTAAPSTVAATADSADQSAASTKEDSQPKSKESEEAAAQRRDQKTERTDRQGGRSIEVAATRFCAQPGHSLFQPELHRPSDWQSQARIPAASN